MRCRWGGRSRDDVRCGRLPSPYHCLVAPSLQPGGKKPPAPKHDRLIAAIIWFVTGLLAGFAIGIFTGHGWLWLIIGALAGFVLALWRTKPEQQIEQD